MYSTADLPRKIRLTIGGAALAAAALAPHARAQPVRYRIADLGVFSPTQGSPGQINGYFGQGWAINGRGVVAGVLIRGPWGVGSDYAPVLWPGDGLAHDLVPAITTLGASTEIECVNDAGDVIFRARNPANGILMTALWRNGAASFTFCTDPPGSIPGQAIGWVINNNGQIAGSAFWSDQVTHLGYQEIVRWSADQQTTMRLGSLGWMCRPRAMDDNGDMVGFSYLSPSGAEGIHPFVIRNNVMIDLSKGLTLNPRGEALAMNTRGEIVGYCNGSTGRLPVYWAPDRTRTILPVLPGATESIAWSINDTGVIAGTCGGRATVWIAGQVYDLTNYIDFPPDQNWQWLESARAVNSHGQIVGMAHRVVEDGHGDIRAYMITPKPVCPADYDGDGSVDEIDYNLFIKAFEAGGPAADFNGDGFLDPLDYNGFINAFEFGC